MGERAVMAPARAGGRRTRVLHVIQNLNYGGMERVLSDIVIGTDRARFETHVLCLGYTGRYAQGLDAVAKVHLGTRASRLSMIRPSALAAQIRSIGPDVVHSHSGVWYKASLAARLAGVPRVIHTEHGRARPDPWQSRIVDGLAARRTDCVVAVSEVLAQELPHALRMRPDKIVHVPNGVDTTAFIPRPDSGALRTELGLDAATPIIGSIGRLEPIKGFDIMVEAYGLLRRMPGMERTVLVIGGEGSQRPLLEARLHALGVDDRAFLLGWRDDVHDLQSAFTLFTLASRSEGTSISLLEAMSAGLPPVVTDVGGNSVVVGPELSTTCLVPSEQPEALAQRWADLLGAPERRTTVAARARARVVEVFALGTTVRAYERLYDPTLELAPPGANPVRGVPPTPRSSALRPPVM